MRPENTHVFYVYVVQVQNREQFRNQLEQQGIATGIHYPVPVHLQPACAHYEYQRGMLPVTEAVADHIVSLPMYPELTDEQIQMVVNAVKKAAFHELLPGNAAI
jgi:dTDP-4-amino-4,6-dideoxygalactose transaminase